MIPSARLSRLRWLCRRGMKELDVLLEAFLAGRRVQLLRGEYPGFEQLLQTEDDLLWDWIQGRARPADPELDALVEAIRAQSDAPPDSGC